MVRLAQERVLLIGDPHRQVHAALAQALPGVQVTSAPSFFDGIAELSAGNFTAVVAPAEPIERRPEAAVRQLRELVGDGRLVLFGNPTLELLNRKMLGFGVDDYLITPPSAGEIEQVFRAKPVRPQKSQPTPQEDFASDGVATKSWLGSGVVLADVVLEALTNSPQDAVGAAVQLLGSRLSHGARLNYWPGESSEAPAPQEGITRHEHPVHERINDREQQVGVVELLLPSDGDQSTAQPALRQLAQLLAKIATLQDRYNGLKKFAFTDELTGLFNARYFRHFLKTQIDRGRAEHFPVTLLLFDIDDFKRYNDQYGHVVGDEILRQTAAVMRTCTRAHDRVCRIGGDEFAVVFVDKEGPRQPRDPAAAPAPGPHRPPQTPEQVFHRFKRMIEDEKFPVLGTSGKGVLGISAGMAVYPYDAQDAAGLIQEADNRLMHGAKKRGKNSLVIVGTDAPIFPPSEAKP
jgi:GGDEF domain-containing protein